eukprot:jgi/Galph1/981/GphlegSOOS_G5644.1
MYTFFSRLGCLRRLCSRSRTDNTNLLVFLGAPGVGKGTYASRVASLLGFQHVSLGDIFRAESQKNEWLRSELQQGNLLPDSFVLRSVDDVLNTYSSNPGIILDGFPRTLEQAASLEKIRPVGAVYLLKLREDILIKKLSFRRVCGTCGKTFNLANITEPGYEMPPLLPPSDCQGPCNLFQREDDKEDIVRSRLELYKESHAPIEEFYRKRNILHIFELKGGVAKMLPELGSLISQTCYSPSSFKHAVN